MGQKELDKKCYKLAYEYLLGFEEYGVTKKLIDKYLHFTEQQDKKDLNGIYKRLLKSSMNAGMRPGVILGLIGDIDNLGEVLFGFDAKEVIKHYKEDSDNLLKKIEDGFKKKKNMRKTKRSIWPLFCRSILTGADFISQFKDAEEFYEWVDFFDNDDRARVALPFLISQEVDGMGFALACDFLKEIGYINFGKPDVHIKAIFKGLNLCDQQDNDYKVFNAIVRVAKNVGVSAYNVDKLFWLIGSGNFYDDAAKDGRKLKVPTDRDAFIKSSKKALAAGK